MANSSLRVVSVVRGYHVYKDDWNPDIGDLLGVEVEETNIHDRFACAVTANGQTVGHVPREFSRTVYYFIKKQWNGTRISNWKEKTEYSTHERLGNTLYL